MTTNLLDDDQLDMVEDSIHLAVATVEQICDNSPELDGIMRELKARHTAFYLDHLSEMAHPYNLGLSEVLLNCATNIRDTLYRAEKQEIQLCLDL